MVVKCLERVSWLVHKVSCSLFTLWTSSSFAASTPSFSQEEIILVARYCLKLIYHNQKRIPRVLAQMFQYWGC